MLPNGPNTNWKRAGSKKKYSADQLMHVWIYVQAGIQREKSNAHRFCTKKRTFRWIDGGMPSSPEAAAQLLARSRINHSASGRTLWRRYQEAVAFLKAESESYRDLKELGAHSANIGPVSPTEKWWRRELKLALKRQ